MRRAPIQPTRSPLATLLQGEHSWGTVDVTTSGGALRHQLVVYPPGLGRDQRVALRLWRTFSVWGLGLWILLVAALLGVLSPWSAIAMGTAVCAVAGLAALACSGSARGAVRTLTTGRGASVQLHELTERLVRADAALAAGTISRVEHEAELWRVYDRVGSSS